MRDRRQQRKSRGGPRRAVPKGLGMGLGVVVVLMILAFAAIKVRDCRDEAPLSESGQR